jgi:ATP-binding cassette subfamily B protein
MVFYSWLLTIVALATVPLFAFLTLVFAPIIRSQSRTKAERNAETQSYLVEVVSGIQTVKAQNIDLILDGNGKRATVDILVVVLRMY